MVVQRDAAGQAQRFLQRLQVGAHRREPLQKVGEPADQEVTAGQERVHVDDLLGEAVEEEQLSQRGHR